MILILSPAKSLDFESPVPFSLKSEPRFIQESNYLAKKLSQLSKKKLNDLMHVSKTLIDLNYSRYKDWDSSNQQRKKQAVFAFNGEVYRGLSIADFTEKEIQYAQKHLRILSGIYGVLEPMDLIQPYRLEMGSKFQVTSKQNNLYKYWDNKIGNSLLEELSSHKEPVLVNLASKEYFKAINEKSYSGKIIHITFKENKNGEYKVIGTFSKLARGQFSRFFVKNKLSTIESLKNFQENDYRYHEALSSEQEFVFTR